MPTKKHTGIPCPTGDDRGTGHHSETLSPQWLGAMSLSCPSGPSSLWSWIFCSYYISSLGPTTWSLNALMNVTRAFPPAATMSLHLRAVESSLEWNVPVSGTVFQILKGWLSVIYSHSDLCRCQNVSYVLTLVEFSFCLLSVCVAVVKG